MPRRDEDAGAGYGRRYGRTRRPDRGREFGTMPTGPVGPGWAGPGRAATGPGPADPTVRRGGRQRRKSRWQTDYGDPFGDRERGTPFRVVRGGWRGDEEWPRRQGPAYDGETAPSRAAYDREYRGGSRGYDAAYRARPEYRYDRAFRGRPEYDYDDRDHRGGGRSGHVRRSGPDIGRRRYRRRF